MNERHTLKRKIAKVLFALKSMKTLLNRNADRRALVLDILRKPFYDQDTKRELELVRHIFTNQEKQKVIQDIFDSPYYSQDTSGDPYHENFSWFIDEVNKLEKPHILELGARKVNQKDWFTGYGEYVVFDIHEDEDVDVAGDIHQLSTYFEAGRFDAVFMVSVMEHLAMPWKAMLEINKVMKPGALLYTSTHPVWPAHALPWDFWRYTKETFPVLLNRFTGFEVLRCDEGLPCMVLPFGKDVALKHLHREPANLGVSMVARKTGEVDDRLTWGLEVDEMIDSVYPKV
ncbi:MAG: methyltransferase domain-containing protein [Thermoleophilia bacterium]